MLISGEFSDSKYSCFSDNPKYQKIGTYFYEYLQNKDKSKKFALMLNAAPDEEVKAVLYMLLKV